MMNPAHDVTFRLRPPVADRPPGAGPQSLDEVWVVEAPDAGLLIAAFADAVEAHRFCERLNIDEAVDEARGRKESPTT